MIDITAIDLWTLTKIPYIIIGLVILPSLLVFLILCLLGLPSDKVADFWLNVLKIVFRYKGDSYEKRDN